MRDVRGMKHACVAHTPQAPCKGLNLSSSWPAAAARRMLTQHAFMQAALILSVHTLPPSWHLPPAPHTPAPPPPPAGHEAAW
jgi:hypothetical protein